MVNKTVRYMNAGNGSSTRIMSLQMHNVKAHKNEWMIAQPIWAALPVDYRFGEGQNLTNGVLTM